MTTQDGAAISNPPVESNMRYVTDAIVFATLNGVRHVLLIRRGWPPYKGKLALPGGHVETDETSRDACARELAEETGLVLATWQLRASGLYDGPTRDARGRYVCVAYSVDLGEMSELPPVRGGDDAEHAVWMPVAEVLSDVASMTHALTEEDAPDALLAFDHWSIISDALANVTGSADALVGQRLPNLDPVSPGSSDDGQRYMLVSDDDGHDYVIEASHEVEWHGLDNDAINEGPAWAWPVGGSPTLVTFAAPLIDGDPLD